MEQGWIKLHRKLLDNPIISKPTYTLLWIILLLKASHKEQKIMWNGEFIIIKEGQILTGRDQLVKESRLPATTIERILKYLENGHQIGQQKTTKYRIITILNWKEYQQVDIKTDNKRTTNGQQTDTYKNDKELKRMNKNIDTTALKQKFFSNPLMEEIKKQYPNRNYEFQFGIMCDWWLANKKKLPQHISALSNWLKNTKEEIIIKNKYANVKINTIEVSERKN